MKLQALIQELKKLENKTQAKILARFFKTGPGEYGEGDVFLGIKVPEQRRLAKKYSSDLDLKELAELLKNPIHEMRLVALLVLVEKYKRAEEKDRAKLATFYLKNLKGINNWDLVDLSADKILGDYYYQKDTKVLDRLLKSKNLWQRRIAVLSTFQFIKRGQVQKTLEYASKLLSDQEDLMHKASGWMLREVGKVNKSALLFFLDKHLKKMPRTMLRYAIEKFPEKERLHYLKK